MSQPSRKSPSPVLHADASTGSGSILSRGGGAERCQRSKPRLEERLKKSGAGNTPRLLARLVSVGCLHGSGNFLLRDVVRQDGKAPTIARNPDPFCRRSTG